MKMRGKEEERKIGEKESREVMEGGKERVPMPQRKEERGAEVKYNRRRGKRNERMTKRAKKTKEERRGG